MPPEPAGLARWVFRAVAGDAAGPARRIIAGFCVAILVLGLSILAPISVLASLSLIAALVERIEVPTATPGRLTVAWGLVAMTTVGFVGGAAAVSWTSGRRGRHRRDPKSAAVSPAVRDHEVPSDPEEERAIPPPGQ